VGGNNVARWFTIILLILCFPFSAPAGPPIVTDDTGTPGPGKWETNMGFTVEKRHRESVYQVPTLDLNYGIGGHVQLNYSAAWLVLHGDEGTKSGAGNSEVAVKWRFLDQDKEGIDLSIYPRFLFNNPTSSADRSIVDKGTIFRLPFQMEKKIGIITINPEIGHDFHQEGGDTWLYGLAVKYAEIKGIEALAEIFGTADNRFTKEENAFNIGIRKDVREDVSLHVSVGKGLQGVDHPTLLSYVGIQMRF
jgi:hypothetical protein